MIFLLFALSIIVVVVEADKWPYIVQSNEKVGVYSWGFAQRLAAASANRLQWTIGAVSSLGTSTIRLYLGPSDFYDVNPNPFETIQAAKNYAPLFSSSSFTTFLLTVYTPGYC